MGLSAVELHIERPGPREVQKQSKLSGATCMTAMLQTPYHGSICGSELHAAGHAAYSGFLPMCFGDWQVVLDMCPSALLGKPSA